MSECGTDVVLTKKMDGTKGEVEVVGEGDWGVEGRIVQPVTEAMEKALVIAVKVEEGDGVVVGTEVLKVLMDECSGIGSV